MVDMDKMRGKRDPSIEAAIEMLSDIEDANGVSGGITLNQWEEEFIESVTDRLSEGRKLTETQMDKLVEIWEKV